MQLAIKQRFSRSCRAPASSSDSSGWAAAALNIATSSKIVQILNQTATIDSLLMLQCEGKHARMSVHGLLPDDATLVDGAKSECCTARSAWAADDVVSPDSLDPFTHKPFYTTDQQIFTQRLLHTKTFTQKLLHTEHFYTHTHALTHRHFYTHML